MNKIHCKGCGHSMTWAEQCKQWGRMLRTGLDEAQAKSLQPRCQKCVTAYFREQAILTVIAESYFLGGPVREIARLAEVPWTKAVSVIEELIRKGRLTGTVAYGRQNRLWWEPETSDVPADRARRLADAIPGVVVAADLDGTPPVLGPSLPP